MIDVACAIILRSDGTALAALRGPTMRMPGVWEFPGGKLEPGEDSATALVREIREELDIAILPRLPLDPVEFHSPELSIRLHPWIADLSAGKPRLIEHAEIRWLDAAALPTLTWAEADRPVLARLLELATTPGRPPDLRSLHHRGLLPGVGTGQSGQAGAD